MRVVIVAPGAMAAETLQACLRTVPPFAIVGYADSRRFVPAHVATASPQLIVVDGREPSDELLACVKRLRDAVPHTKIVMITADVDDAWLGEACRNGLDAAVSVRVGKPMLGSLVHHIALGTVFHSFGQAAEVADTLQADPFDLLTARELEILRLVASGASNSRVASTLWVTEQTVKFHLSNVYRKLDVANRTEASHYAHVNGLLDESRDVRTLRAADAVVAA
jgi:DNA-binding NarL/FixJ family response regulator